MKGVLAGLAALFTFSGTNPDRLYLGGRWSSQ